MKSLHAFISRHGKESTSHPYCFTLMWSELFTTSVGIISIIALLITMGTGVFVYFKVRAQMEKEEAAASEE